MPTLAGFRFRSTSIYLAICLATYSRGLFALLDIVITYCARLRVCDLRTKEKRYIPWHHESCASRVLCMRVSRVFHLVIPTCFQPRNARVVVSRSWAYPSLFMITYSSWLCGRRT